jgi:cob(I)alamin adenosyltransferase
MNDLIFLDEQRIRKQLKVAQDNLIALRTLFCEGENVSPETMRAVEKTIQELESQLENLIIGQ